MILCFDDIVQEWVYIAWYACSNGHLVSNLQNITASHREETREREEMRERRREREETREREYIHTSDDLSGRFLLKSVMELSRKGILELSTLFKASRVIFLNAIMMPTIVVLATRSSESVHTEKQLLNLAREPQLHLLIVKWTIL
jgi:predicted O-methyltransferase YrrM